MKKEKANPNKQLSNQEIASFCRQTSLIIKAGITPSEGMEIMATDTVSEEGRELLSNISSYCKQGLYFHHALEETKVFPSYVVKLIALGEESGNLDEVLESLADYYEREDSIAEGIRSAISYPLIMIAMMMFIILVLIVKVLPIFKQVFDQLGTQMTPLAQSLMDTGTLLSRIAIGFTLLIGVLVILFLINYRVASFRKKVHEFLTTFPLTKNFNLNIAAGRFASGMYLIFSSGMDMFQGLDMIEDLSDNAFMSQKVRDVKESLKNRMTFPEAIAKAEIFSALYTRMILVAFNAGYVENTMKWIAHLYDEEIDKQMRRFIAIIEPTLVIILSLIVGVILISVLLPLMGIMSSIG